MRYQSARMSRDAELQTALDRVALDGLRLVTKWIAVAYVISVPLPFLRFPINIAVGMLFMQLTCALVAICFAAAADRDKIAPRHANMALAGVLALPISSLLIQTYVAYAPDRTVSFGLFLVGIGLFSLSLRWFTLLLAFAFSGWSLVIWLTPGTDPTLAQSVVPLGLSAVVGILARTTRVRGVARLEQLRRQEAEHLKHARESEAKFRGIVSRMHDVFFRTNRAGLIEMVSPSIKRYGIRPEDLIGTSAFRFYSDQKERDLLLERLSTQGTVSNYELDFLGLNGEKVAATINLAPLLDEEGNIAGLEGLVHDITEQKEKEARQRADAEDSATLAYVGERLIESLDEPTLLDRLCELTTRIFKCDASHTFLLGEHGVVITAGHGDTPEQWDSLRLVTIPNNMAEPLVERLRMHGATQTAPDTPGAQQLPPILPGFGTTSVLYFPLRRGEELVGFQSAAYRGRTESFTERQMQIAQRIGHLASLALENARLVDALERANAFKTRFLANMSHELRTPLNVIMGYNQILLDNGCGPLAPEQAGMLERVQANAAELLNLVCATLEISREESQVYPLEIRELAVETLLRSLVEERGTMATSRGLSFEFNVDPELPVLWTDPRKLKMVLGNLVDNALKFTMQGSVRVEAGPSEGGVEFRVSDTGVGMRPEDMEAIFEPFRQGVTPAGSLEGVGLGLHIARSLLKALKGKMSVASELGQGSTFRVWLPTVLAAESAAVPENLGLLGGLIRNRRLRPQ